MQENQQNCNFKYFNSCTTFAKLISVLILCCFFVCCGKKQVKHNLSLTETSFSLKTAININKADVKTLENLPHIGAKTAQKIIEHREKFGEFRKPEHLLLVRGISDKIFREIRNFIKVE